MQKQQLMENVILVDLWQGGLIWQVNLQADIESRSEAVRHQFLPQNRGLIQRQENKSWFRLWDDAMSAGGHV
jgi:hypothetical protein